MAYAKTNFRIKNDIKHSKSRLTKLCILFTILPKFLYFLFRLFFSFTYRMLFGFKSEIHNLNTNLSKMQVTTFQLIIQIILSVVGIFMLVNEANVFILSLISSILALSMISSKIMRLNRQIKYYKKIRKLQIKIILFKNID